MRQRRTTYLVLGREGKKKTSSASETQKAGDKSGMSVATWGSESLRSPVANLVTNPLLRMF